MQSDDNNVDLRGAPPQGQLTHPHVYPAHLRRRRRSGLHAEQRGVGAIGCAFAGAARRTAGAWLAGRPAKQRGERNLLSRASAMNGTPQA
jgi:hypothetical protein